MVDFSKLAIPKKERLEVQLTDGTEEHNINYVITSLATIKGDKIYKNFRLYSVADDGQLTQLEKRDGDPYFEVLKGTAYESKVDLKEISKNLKLLGIILSFVSLSLSIVQLIISETLKKLSQEY